ncbi:zinc ABC transporter substrate-binding protein [Streptomyces thermolineatus]|uniref:Zinc ABC transporter substrate-binding protein n=1 Tax=Streptomyces thermolineatus TaxID=44033 RepID=A0ABP5ZX43_9ACTN
MNIRRRRLLPAALAGLAAAGLTAVTGCSSSDSAQGGGGDGRVDVVASFYPVQFLAEQIGGKHVKVTALTAPGVEPHDLELKPQQVAALSEADLVVYLKGLQPAVDEAVEQSGAAATVDAATLTELENHGTGGDGHNHGGEAGGEHAEEEHAGEGAPDPHVWLDPVKYAEVAEGVGKALAEADPGHADAYAKNTDALVAKLKGLDADFENGLKNRSTDTFITAHAAFGYLAERYGLDQEAIALDPESEPSAARMKELHEHAKEDNVSTIFFETLASDRTAKALADDLGLRTDVLDPLEGITDASKGNDYFEVMESNLAALKKALGSK